MVLAQAPGESRVAVRGFRAATPTSAPSVMLSAFLPDGHLSLGGIACAEARQLATMLLDAADFAEGRGPLQTRFGGELSTRLDGRG